MSDAMDPFERRWAMLFEADRLSWMADYWQTFGLVLSVIGAVLSVWLGFSNLPVAILIFGLLAGALVCIIVMIVLDLRARRMRIAAERGFQR